MDLQVCHTGLPKGHIELAHDMEDQTNRDQNNLESEIRLIVDEIYPLSFLMNVLKKFSALGLPTRIILTRGILSGPLEALQAKKADIAITFKYPRDCLAEYLITVTSAPFAALNHPLHLLGHPIREQDLLQERQIIVMDTNQNQSIDFGFLSPHSAWYVDSLEMKLQMLQHGLGYAWINEQFVEERQVNLKHLPLAQASHRHHSLYIAYREIGQASLMLIELIKAEK